MSQQPKVCKMCYGNGHFQVDGEKFRCEECNGTGKIIQADIGPPPDGTGGDTGQ